MVDVLLSCEILEPARCEAFVAGPDTGGIVVFVGTVRNQTGGKQVVRLEFEAYEPMALSEMRKIAESALVLYAVQRVSIHHRIGVLEVGELPVVIAVGSAHRKAAFEACAYCIDTLKERVPIWKKEVFEDGAVWVAAHP